MKCPNSKSGLFCLGWDLISQPLDINTLFVCLNQLSYCSRECPNPRRAFQRPLIIKTTLSRIFKRISWSSRIQSSRPFPKKMNTENPLFDSNQLTVSRTLRETFFLKSLFGSKGLQVCIYWSIMMLHLKCSLTLQFWYLSLWSVSCNLNIIFNLRLSISAPNPLSSPSNLTVNHTYPALPDTTLTKH